MGVCCSGGGFLSLQRILQTKVGRFCCDFSRHTLCLVISYLQCWWKYVFSQSSTVSSLCPFSSSFCSYLAWKYSGKRLGSSSLDRVVLFLLRPFSWSCIRFSRVSCVFSSFLAGSNP